MSGCIGEPVSYLALERYALGELTGDRGRAIGAHLDACPACRACLDGIAGDTVVLRALPVLPVPTPWWRRWTWAPVGALALAAVVLLMLRPGPRAPVPGPRLALHGLGVAGVKGGDELVLGLVRERAGAISHDPTGFADDDRWKLVITCPPEVAELPAEVVVFQAERAGGRAEASFPLAVTSIRCGNQVVLPGAFRITGDQPATVCLALGPAADRAGLARRGPRGDQLACLRLVAEPGATR